jgi:transcriptional regulator with XRE-family HTH domain
MHAAEDTTGSGGSATPLECRSGRKPPDRYADLWGRFTALRESRRWRAVERRRSEVLTNLVELVVFADPADYVRLHELIQAHSHEWVADRQGGLEPLLGEDARIRTETGLIWRIGDEAHTRARLAGAGIGENEATDVAASCYGHMFWLLLRDMDQAGPGREPTTPEELLDVVRHGTISEWRASLAPIAANPWAPYGERLAELAEEAGLPVVANSMRECRRVYLLRAEDQERNAIAREIRRRVAVSGLTQREFATYVGTSPSRLSTYANGKVTPSAAMMLRIQRASRVLHERADADPRP